MKFLWNILERILVREEPEKENLLNSKEADRNIPVNEASFISYVTISWLTPLIVKIFKQRDDEIKDEDVWTCSDLETCEQNIDRLESLWNEELGYYGRKDASFLRIWIKFIRNRLLLLIVVMCFNAVVTFLVTGYMADLIVSYLEADESSTAYAIGLVVSNFIGQIVRCTSFLFILFYGSHTGIRFRAGVMGLSYKKLLQLKNAKGKTASEMITIFGADALRMFMNCQMFVYIIGAPIYFLIGTIYIYHLIGYWCFAAVSICAVGYFTQLCITEIIGKLRQRTLVWTDKRIRKMNEILSNIKMIKMYAWEDSFTDYIKGIRHKETKTLLLSAILMFLSNAIIAITPSLASVTTIALYSASGNQLKASTAFSLVATLGYMRIVVVLVSHAARTLAETRVSFKRIKRLMLKDDYQTPSGNVVYNANAIELMDGTFQWDGDTDDEDDSTLKKSKPASNELRDSPADSNRHSTTFTAMLKNINLYIKKGRHVGVCGSVGCGKSSLLQAILGRMPKEAGNLAVDGTIAYAAQQAWIFNATLSENILFGSPYNSDWYAKVLQSCGLVADIDMLANGDATEIGDKGINLSGGQKQRVSIARAVYSNRDIYLLDDPLSAVDVHVGKHLFHECIKKILKNKTVILVTHQLQYLEHCDEIFVMVDGEIVETGTPQRLLINGGYYTALMEQYNNTMADMAVSDGNIALSEKQGTELPILQINEKNASISENHVDKATKGAVTEKETTQKGSVDYTTYKAYVRAAGGFSVVAIVLLAYIIDSATLAFSEWWLSIWIQHTTVAELETNITNTRKPEVYFPVPGNRTFTENITSWADSKGLEETADVYFIVYVCTTAAILISTVVKGIIAGVVYIRASDCLHSRALQRVVRAPMKFFDANPPGRILNRFSRDQDEGDVFIPNFLDNALQVLFLGTIALGTAVFNLPWFLVALCPILFLCYIIKSVSFVTIRQLKRLENVVRSPLLSHVNISSQGLSTIVSFQQERSFMYSFMQYADRSSAALFLYEAGIRWNGVRLDLLSAMLSVATPVVLVLTKGSIPPALAALSLTMCFRTASSIQYAVRMLNEVEARFTSIERIHEYTKIEVEQDVHSVKLCENWPSQGRVAFNDVIMKYRDDMDPVLRNINFEIAPKEKVGIVGRTGAGKSSLAVALFRLTDLSEGHIYIDGIDIREVSRKELRSKMSSIPQDPVLFAGTLRYNLDPFEKYTDQEIWKALEQVHMKEKMQLSDMTLHLFIEENGENFSVGERQLICLARAILRHNKILVLDEATASIDTSTDAMIQETIRESFSDCTVLTIAHRLNTVLHCDLILVMEAGRVVESGTPQALLADQHSHFSNMLRVQAVKSQK